MRGEITRKLSRELIQKFSTGITVKQPGLAVGGVGHHESVAAEDDVQIRGTERLPESHASTGENLKSTSSPRDSSAKGKKTDLSGEKEQEEKTVHEYGNVSREDKKIESIIPIRGKDNIDDHTTKKVLGEEMLWESVGE